MALAWVVAKGVLTNQAAWDMHIDVRSRREFRQVAARLASELNCNYVDALLDLARDDHVKQLLHLRSRFINC
jgi:hypothetical protein